MAIQDEIWFHQRIKPRPYDGRTMPDGAWFETKFDGFRVTFFKQKDGSLRVFGREVAYHLELTEKLKYWEWFFRARDMLPNHSSLDCELYAPGQPATKVANWLKEQKEGLELCAFALPVLAGQDMSSRDMGLIENIVRDTMGFSMPKRQVYRGQTEEELRARAMDRGLEGYVIKTSHYEDGTWWKVKKVSTVDCVVTGIQPGRGKYEGLCGALILSLRTKPGGELQVVGKCGGMSDEERRSINDSCIDRVCEVGFQEVGVGGKLVQPRFYRWREDKSNYWCTLDQLGPAFIGDIDNGEKEQESTTA